MSSITTNPEHVYANVKIINKRSSESDLENLDDNILIHQLNYLKGDVTIENKTEEMEDLDCDEVIVCADQCEGSANINTSINENFQFDDLNPLIEKGRDTQSKSSEASDIFTKKEKVLIYGVLWLFILLIALIISVYISVISLMILISFLLVVSLVMIIGVYLLIE